MSFVGEWLLLLLHGWSRQAGTGHDGTLARWVIQPDKRRLRIGKRPFIVESRFGFRRDSRRGQEERGADSACQCKSEISLGKLPDQARRCPAIEANRLR